MMRLFSLEGKNILVTGASSGIGRAAVRHIAAAGGTVMATGRNEDRLRKTMEGLEGENHKAVPIDLLDADAVKSLVASSPNLDGVVHCAGVARIAPVRFTTDKILRMLLATNLEAPIALTRVLIQKDRLNDGTSIVFLSSLSAVSGWAGHVGYGATKAALLGMSRSLASELAGRRIRSNCLLPGMVKTPMLTGGLSKDQLEEDEKKYPFGYGKPADVASTIVFFLSDASRWITGQTLIMDGGATLQ